MDLLTFYKYGGKNLYYFNTYDGQEDVTMIADEKRVVNDDEVEDLEAFEDDEDCDSCKL